MFTNSFAQRSKSIYYQVLQYELTGYVTATSSTWRNINVRTNSNLNSSVHGAKPLALILPWLGATKKGVSKYASLYENNGIDVMVHYAKISDFLWPRKGLNSSLLLLDNLKYEVKKADEERGRPIIIHSFSLGCYFYALMMMQMLKHSESYDILWKGIVGQVIDSPVVGSLNEMAYGVSKITFPNSARLSSTVKKICMLFFALTQKHTVKYYDESIRVFYKAAPASTYLILSCRNDPMLIPKALDELVDDWRERIAPKCGIYHMWDSSLHAQHLRVQPEQYKQLFNEFLTAALSPVEFDLKGKLGESS